MRALLVHNPTAGTKAHDKDSIVDALHLADFKVDYVSTKDDRVKDALKDAPDLVVAAGGDGTVAYVFTHLPDHSIPIGVIPLGSANNVARSLGIAGTPQELAEQWRNGEIRPFNLMVVGGLKEEKLCTEAFGVGLIAALIERRAKGKKADGADDIRRGRRALSEILAEAEPLDIEINVDGQPWKSDLLGVEVLTIPFTGPALPLAHDADPSDPLLDVIGVERKGGEAFVEWIKARLDAAGYCPPGEEHRASVARRGKPHRRQTRQGKTGLAAGDLVLSSRAAAHSRGGEASGRPEERKRWIAMSQRAAGAHAIEDLDEIEQMAVALTTLAGLTTQRAVIPVWQGKSACRNRITRRHRARSTTPTA
jgi:diacylglycerol kinase (ATP)